MVALRNNFCFVRLVVSELFVEIIHCKVIEGLAA